MKSKAIASFILFVFYCQLVSSICGGDDRHFVGGIFSKVDHVLLGHNVSAFKTREMIRCAQKCLSTDDCGSMNYRFNESWCELKKRIPDLLTKDIIFRQGAVFVLFK